MNYTGTLIAHGNAEQLIEAIRLEMGEFGRSKVSIAACKEGAQFTIESADAVALRATLNAIAQSLTVFEKMQKV